MEWLIFELHLRYAGVRLRAMHDQDLPRLGSMLPDDFELDPRAERFVGLAEGRDRLRRFTLGVWRSRGTWSPKSWCLDLVVEHRGEIVGLQTLEADDFPKLRTVNTASWLVPNVRGLGLGVAMRAAVLGLALDHLGAVAAVSSARLDNGAPLGVWRRLGYIDNGVSLTDSPRGVVELQHLRLTRNRWATQQRKVEVSRLQDAVRGSGPRLTRSRQHRLCHHEANSTWAQHFPMIDPSANTTPGCLPARRNSSSGG